MNNLKRVLSLGLTGAMLSGMMLVGASAADVKDFSDASEIKNQEAVTTMVALNVIAGKDTGAFDPSATVTRAEMAKMITIMLNGGKEPVLSTNATPAYSDIGGHWAQKYIEYCSKNGIIAGQGDGTFNPDGTVTGSQAAKMALVALGYDSNVFNFTGIDWEVNVNSTANAPESDLYDDLSGINPSEGMTRDNAAQLLYNALDARVMDRNYDSVASSGEVTYKYALSNVTMMEKKFDAVKVEGIVVANEAATLGTTTKNSDNIVIGNALDAERTRITVTNYGTGNGEQNSFNGSLTLKASTGVSELGQKVNVYVKNGSSTTKADILGTVIVSADNTVVVDHSGDSIADVADDNDLKLASGYAVYTDYATSLSTSGNIGSHKVSGVDTACTIEDDTKNYVYAGVTKTLIDNDDDGEAEYVFLNNYVLGYVSKYSTKDDGSISVVADGVTYNFDDKKDVVGFDDVAREDYVLASVYGGKLHLTKPETVTGDLTAYASGSLTVEGEKYDISKATTITTGSYALNAANGYGSSTTIDTEATFYLDANGRVVASGDAEEAAYKYALGWGASKGGSIDDNKVKMTTEDGTTKTYVINSKSTLKVASADTFDSNNPQTSSASAIGAVVAYSLTSGGEAKLEWPGSTTNGSGNATFEKNKTLVKLNGSAGSASASVNTTFFYVEMNGSAVDKVSVYTGYTNAPSVDTSTSAALIRNTNNKLTAVKFVDSGASSDGASQLFVYKFGSTYSDYTEAHVYLNGSDENEVIKLDGTGYVSGDADKLYTYTVNSDGYYELDNPADKNGDGTENDPEDYYKTGTVSDVSRNTIVVGSNEYVINSSSVIIDNIDNPSTPSAILGGSVSEYDTIQMIVDDDTVLMLVITGSNPDFTVTTAGSADKASYKAGETVTITGLSNNATYFVNGDVGVVTANGSGTLTFTMPAINATVTQVYALGFTTATITAAAPAGAYTATITDGTLATGYAAGGATITVTVECTTAPTANTDTITLAGTGITPSGTQTFTALGTKTITFNMPASAGVSDLAISVSNA